MKTDAQTPLLFLPQSFVPLYLLLVSHFTRSVTVLFDSLAILG